MIRPTALILTAHYGSGHIQVANVLASELRNRGYDPIISDLFGESYPRISQITQSLFIKSFSYGHSFYKWWYYGTNKLHSKGIAQFSRYLGRKRLQELITKHQPQFVISTFPLNSAPFLIKKARYKIPTYTVITDYCAHPFWVNPLIDQYFVASDAVKDGLIQDHNIHQKRITVSGIPIQPKFERDVDMDAVYEKYKISPKKQVVTVLAGAQGVLKNVKEICLNLLENSDSQLVTICGNNKELYEKLLPLTLIYPDTFKLFGYVKEIHEVFSITHCLITKPGGITITEAAALRVPLILYRPVPGQEAENAKHFYNKGASVTSYTVAKTCEHVERILEDTKVARRMKIGLNTIHIAQSAKLISDYSIHKTERQSSLSR
ncbi:glycosyltransferase [Fictibacillus nanhaiensis]|uniref:MGDG synthase family glycosyltransferase n=1 Tax=Fictibacillus nanhaiensis TaxID=742169 RepID=UPI001C96BF5C|nr:glycosyltransferase [Fictibacillus nanhaiensis]MBY6038193.1 glycosyltransferase [Fictibacillus nanhaiensis]